MSVQIHSFRLEARFGAAEVFRALKYVCDHDNQREYDPAFGFDWIKNRLAITANSPEGVEICLRHFLEQIDKLGGSRESFLPGPVQETDGRWTQPIGVVVLDAATFGEMIGRTLVDLGMRGIKVLDSADCCRVMVRITRVNPPVDYKVLIQEFPLPPYIKLVDEGLAEEKPAPKPPSTSRKSKKKKRK